jgi:hypothetical protein
MLLEATFAQLAVLQPLTALQSLELTNIGILGDLPQEQHTTTHPVQMPDSSAAAGQAAVEWEQLQEYLEQREQQIIQVVFGEVDEEEFYEGHNSLWGLLQLQPACYHSVAGVLALTSAINNLPCLRAVELQLPLRLPPGAPEDSIIHQPIVQQLERCHPLDWVECGLSCCGRGHVLRMKGGMQS